METLSLLAVKALQGGGGSAYTGERFTVTSSDSMPIVRSDGSPLQLGDFVKGMKSGAWSAFTTVDGYTFTNRGDTYVYSQSAGGVKGWTLDESTSSIATLVQQAVQAATNAQTYKVQAGNYASSALDSKNLMLRRVQYYNTIEEYDSAVSTGIVYDDTISFLPNGEVVSGGNS